MHVIPMIITRMLQGLFCDTGISCTFYGGKICSVGYYVTYINFFMDRDLHLDNLILTLFQFSTIQYPNL